MTRARHRSQVTEGGYLRATAGPVISSRRPVRSRAFGAEPERRPSGRLDAGKAPRGRYADFWTSGTLIFG